jgi:hypothetical protein
MGRLINNKGVSKEQEEGTNKQVEMAKRAL